VKVRFSSAHSGRVGRKLVVRLQFLILVIFEPGTPRLLANLSIFFASRRRWVTVAAAIIAEETMIATKTKGLASELLDRVRAEPSDPVACCPPRSARE
jgi:hypothetical protein